MRLIDADALLETLNNLKAHGGSPAYRRALSDALHDFFPQIIANQKTIAATCRRETTPNEEDSHE